MAVHPDECGLQQTHPDLRRVARLVPRRMAWPLTLPIQRMIFSVRRAGLSLGYEFDGAGRI
jgi:hypothetical protein